MKLLLDEIVDYNNYENDLIFFIDETGKDFRVKDILSYSKWVETHKDYPHIKVEGLENNPQINADNKYSSIHLFVCNIASTSFKEHADDTNVYLQVLKGKKYISMNNNMLVVNENESINIPKGTMHKVDSDAGTIALSFGYE